MIGGGGSAPANKFAITKAIFNIIIFCKIYNLPCLWVCIAGAPCLWETGSVGNITFAVLLQVIRVRVAEEELACRWQAESELRMAHIVLQGQ